MKIKGTDKSGAIFSDCGKYRYRLWRVWNHELPRVCCIMLNPSTADEIDNDATIERRVRHVKQWMNKGHRAFGSVEIVNAFALRSTDPFALYSSDDPVGPENDKSILSAVRTAIAAGGLVLCGWGSHAAKLKGISGHGTRHQEIVTSLTMEFADVAALRINADGTPGHPLYLGYELLPRWWHYDNLLGELAV